MEERRFPMSVLNYLPRGKRERGRPKRAGEIHQAGTESISETIE